MSLRFLFMLIGFTPAAVGSSLWKPFVGLCFLVFLYYFRPGIWNAADLVHAGAVDHDGGDGRAGLFT